jgi:uncharacterized membrane protein
MSQPTDQQLDLSVARMLRFGVTISAIVVLAGGLLYLRSPWARVPDYSQFTPGYASLQTLRGIFQGAIHLSAKSIIQAGLVLLIATPVARVVFCIVGFARQRRRLYVFVSFLVLLILIYSLSKGAR